MLNGSQHIPPSGGQITVERVQLEDLTQSARRFVGMEPSTKAPHASIQEFMTQEEFDLLNDFTPKSYSPVHIPPIQNGVGCLVSPTLDKEAITEDKGFKYDADKNRLELIPPEAIDALGRALTYGANKYSDRQWEKGMDHTRVYGALLRHLNAWSGGEKNDEESGLSHLDHASACIAFLVTYEQRGMLTHTSAIPPSVVKEGVEG